MALLKTNKIGVYGPKDRLLQKRLSYERLSLTAKTIKVWRYLGSRTNATPAITDIQDATLLENRDRAYSATPIEINAWIETLPESPLDLSRFGIVNPLGNTMQFRLHTYSFEADALGRFVIVGDVFEVPFLSQEGKVAYFEVTDVDRKTEFENFFVIATTVPLADSQETVEIPNKNSDDALLKILDDRQTTETESEFNINGPDTTTVLVDDPTPAGSYDPRPDHGESFLDDPNKKVF